MHYDHGCVSRPSAFELVLHDRKAHSQKSAECGYQISLIFDSLSQLPTAFCLPLSAYCFPLAAFRTASIIVEVEYPGTMGMDTTLPPAASTSAWPTISS